MITVASGLTATVNRFVSCGIYHADENSRHFYNLYAVPKPSPPAQNRFLEYNKSRLRGEQIPILYPYPYLNKQQAQGFLSPYPLSLSLSHLETLYERIRIKTSSYLA